MFIKKTDELQGSKMQVVDFHLPDHMTFAAKAWE